MCVFFFFQAEDGIRYLVRSRGLGDVYKRQIVADAGVDHHGLAARAQHEALEGDDHAAVGRREVLSLIHI